MLSPPRWREDYPEARPVLLYRGQERFLRDGILVLPVEDFLRALVPGRPPLAAFKMQKSTTIP